MATEAGTAFTRYLLADLDHRRAPGEALLALPGARAYVLARLAEMPPESGGQRAVLWQIAVFDAIGRLANDDDGWLRTAVGWLGEGGATWQECASVCAEVGFQAYLADKPDPIAVEAFADLDPSSAVYVATMHLHLIALRLAYRWEAIEQFFDDLGVSIPDLDPYSQAYHVFTLLAGDHPDALAELRRLLTVAGDDYRVNLSLVEGLRLGRTIPRQAELMLELLDHGPLAASPSPDPLYRKAYALRRLGRFEQALRVADQCLQKIPPRQVQDRIRILQERDLILGEQAIEQQAAAARDAVRDQIQAAVATLEHHVGEQTAEIRRATTEGLFRIVEILGVFTALIAVVGGTVASTTAHDLAWWQRGVLALVAGAVAIGFFLLLRLIVAPRPPGTRRGRERSGG